MTIEQIQKIQEKYQLPPYILEASSASKASTNALKSVESNLKDLEKRYFLTQRRKKILEFVTTNMADLWMQRQHELIRKEAILEEKKEMMMKREQENKETLNRMADSLKQLLDGHKRLEDGMARAIELKKKKEDIQEETKRLENVEKVFEKKTPKEIEELLEELQNQKNHLDQMLRQRKAIRDDKQNSLNALNDEVSELVENVEYLSEKAKMGKETVEQRLYKREKIRQWYEMSTEVLSNILGFQVKLDKENFTVCAEFDGNQVVVELDKSDASIVAVKQSVEFDVEDLIEQAQNFDDFSWLLRQIHHRYICFSQRQREVDELVEKCGYNIVYNMRQSPDMLLLVIDDGVFAFKLSNKARAEEALDGKVQIELISAESANEKMVTKVKKYLQERQEEGMKIADLMRHLLNKHS